MKTLASLAAVLVVSLAAGAASAQEARIGWGDLDLSSAAGAEAFDARVSAAADRLCRGVRRPGSRLSDRTFCRAAVRAGLVSRVVPLDKLMEEALAAALMICSYSQLATRAAKEAVNRAFESGLSDGVHFERRLFHALFATADQKEGMDAFVNKRKPVFTHR